MNIFKIFLICGALVFSNIVAEIQILINPVNLLENKIPGTELSRAYDKDVAGKPNAYRFLNKTKDFVIDANSGVITATKIFNYETDPTRFLFIVDTGGIMRHVLTINIIDVPEPPDCTADPLFSSGSATFEIAEDYPIFQSIYKVNVSDEDIAHGDRLTYSIVTELSGPKRGANCFGIDPVNGIVSLKGEDVLDFDAGYHTFQLSVRATDSASLFCQGTIIINIRNINDETPQFEPFPMDSINVTEKKPIGDIVARVKAIDRDKDSSIMYSFKTQQEMFGLDPFTGTITVLQSLNLDNPSNSRSYSLEIEARDDGNNTSSYMFTVFVENVDDPISCDLKFTTGAGVSVSVAENIPASAFIYAILSRDPDLGQEVEFLILNSSTNATAYFALDPHSGVISKTLEPLLDYETDPKFFQLVIAVRNRDSLSLESCVGTITINIQNVNDESPVLIYRPDAPININENLPVGTKLATFTATDRDIEDAVHYEIIGTQKEFAINEDLGDVTVAYPLDYEDETTPKSWVLYVRVYDNERTHSTTGSLTVILQDINDNPPRCSQAIYVIELPENIPVDTTLLSLTCTDRDGTIPNNNITYHLIKDTFSNKTFTLTNSELKIGPMHLDYDNSVFSGMDFKYTLFVRVSDKGIPTLSTIIRIILRVSRINEHNPIGTMTAFSFSVFENSPIDTLVGKITYTDGDWPFNNVQYAIVGGNFGIPPKFYIDSDSGMIKLLNSLDREAVSQYKIAVRITDVANDALPDPLRQRSVTAQVIIHVLSIRASGLILLETILFGSLLLYFPVVILYFEPSTFRCILLRWVRLLGFATVYGTVTLKLHRVLKVFLSRTAQRIPYMTGGRVMRMLAVILLVVFWFLIGWTTSMCQNLERDISLVGQGQTSDHLTFNMCLIDRWDYMTAVAEFVFLLWGVYLCYAVRTVPSAFHEPRYMAVAVHNELIITAIFHTIRFVLASRLQSDWMLMLYFAHTHLTVTVTIGLLLIPKFSHSSNNPRDDIATEAYEDELDMGRSGSYLNSSINSAWSEHSLDPEDIRDELKKLYAQLEIYKRKKMITNNPHLQKKRCSKKGLGRSIMRRITEIPETVSRQCSKEDKEGTDHSVAKGTGLVRKNPTESSGNTGRPKEESLKNRVFSLKKSHSTYDHVRDQTEESSSLPTESQEEEATENSTLESLSSKKLTQKLKEDSEAESTESVPLVCKSASAHNLSSEKKPGHPRTSMLQKSLSVIASAKEKTLGLAGKTQTSCMEERSKSQKPLPKDRESNRKYSNPENTDTKDPGLPNSNHLEELRKPQKSGIMKQQRVNLPTANSDLSPSTTQIKDNFDIGEVCPWEVYDMTPGPSEPKAQKHVSIAASEVEQNPASSSKEKSYKPKAAEGIHQLNHKSVDKTEVCPWESQGQSLLEDENRLLSKTPILPGRAREENGSQLCKTNMCAGQHEELPPKAVASKVENENLNRMGDQEKQTSSSGGIIPGSCNSSNNSHQPLTSRAEVCPWEFETLDQPNAERSVALPVSSALNANKIAGTRK